MIPSRGSSLAPLLLALVLAPLSPASGQPEAAGSLNPLAALDKATLKDFVEKPLFAPSRQRPVVTPPIAYIAPPPSPVIEPPPSLRLLGLVEGATSLVAIVHRNDTGRTETLHPGDQIGSWIVQVMPATLRVMSGDRAFDYALFRGGAQQGPTAVQLPAPFVSPTIVARDRAGARAP